MSFPLINSYTVDELRERQKTLRAEIEKLDGNKSKAANFMKEAAERFLSKINKQLRVKDPDKAE